MRKMHIKKALSLFLVALIIIVSIPYAYADELTDGVFTYTLNSTNNNSVTITKVDGSFSGELVFPFMLDGHYVTEICSNALADCKSITTVNFSQCVLFSGKRSGEHSGGFPENVTTVVLPDLLKTIAFTRVLKATTAAYIQIKSELSEKLGVNPVDRNQAASLYYQDMLNNITDYYSKEELEALLKNSNEYFSAPIYALKLFNADTVLLENEGIAKSLDGIIYTNPESEILQIYGKIEYMLILVPPAKTTVNITEQITSVVSKAFSFSTVQEVHLPETLETVGEAVFYYCPELKYIELNEGIRELSNYMFLYCISLESITVPASVRKIGENAFVNCLSLRDITLKGMLNQDIPYLFSSVGIRLPTAQLTGAYIEANKEVAYGIFGTLNDDKIFELEQSLLDIQAEAEKINPDCFFDYQSLYGNYTLVAHDQPDLRQQIEEAGASFVAFEGHSVTKKNGTPATCTENGMTDTFICTVCGTIGGEILYANHAYSEYFTTDITPTCTDTGSKSRHCTVCGEKTDVTAIPKTAHNFGEWRIKTPSTCSQKGAKYRVCIACGGEETESLALADHSYTVKLVVPTCFKDGYTEHSCLHCSHSFNDRVFPALGHYDGNKNGECDDCGFAMGEPSAQETCNHICHKKGFAGFVYKMLRYFWSVFGVNRKCVCGAYHY